MRRALGNQEFPLDTFAGQLVDETVGVVDAVTPEAVKVLQRFGLADAGVAVALNVLDEGVDALQGLLVFQLPARVFIPGAWGEDRADALKKNDALPQSGWCRFLSFAEGVSPPGLLRRGPS